MNEEKIVKQLRETLTFLCDSHKDKKMIRIIKKSNLALLTLLEDKIHTLKLEAYDLKREKEWVKHLKELKALKESLRRGQIL